MVRIFRPPGTSHDQSEAARHAAHLRGLSSQLLIAPVLVVLILAGLKFGTGATFAQMGLSRQRIGANLVLGYLAG